MRNEITFDYDQNVAKAAKASKEASPSSIFTVNWLEEQLSQSDNSAIGLSPYEFALTIVDLLSSSRSSDDLQTELFDLLGFDRIELIQNVLEHRSDIVNSHQKNKKTLKFEIANAAAANTNIAESNMPIFGCQVTVQSEDEKQLRKQVRKEEKKLQKLLKNTQDDSDEEDFDPKGKFFKRFSKSFPC